MDELWPHQMHAIDDVTLRVREGRRAILLTSPTGMGKSRVVCYLVRHYAANGWYAVIYTNRRLLIDQLSGTLDEYGIRHGIRAADARDERDISVQISSVPTERTRTLSVGADDIGGWDIHGVGRRCLVVVDEAHINTGDTARRLIERHKLAGHVVLGVTATPIGLGDIYETLVVAGCVSEGRKCGALVRADHYGCDEPDMRRLKGQTRGKPGDEAMTPDGQEITAAEQRRAFPMNKAVSGRVIDWFRQLNPDQKPTILFACGVKESLWFAEQFTAAGIPAGHIDGNTIWAPDGWVTARRSTRADLLDASRRGEIKVVCNRFVMREGIDMPWLRHGIFATIFGSLQTYLQAGGRLLRAGGSSDAVTIQDHGGNWWRHGSLNEDRDWHLDDTPARVTAGRIECVKQAKCFRCFTKNPGLPYCPKCNAPARGSPTTCPRCRRVKLGRKCACGHETTLGFRSRLVVQLDGTLTEYRGDVYRPDRVEKRPDKVKDWIAMYFKAKNGKAGMTFAQARTLFASENGWAMPDPEWPYMPVSPLDLYRRVRDVPEEDLTHVRRRLDREASGGVPAEAPGGPGVGGDGGAAEDRPGAVQADHPAV